MNRQNIVRSISISFPTEWHNSYQVRCQTGIAGYYPGFDQRDKPDLQDRCFYRRWLRKSGLESITLDADSTVKSFCGNQEGANSYHPLLVFVSEMKQRSNIERRKK